MKAVRQGIETCKWEYDEHGNINDFKMLERLSYDLPTIADEEVHDKFVIFKCRLLVIPLSMQR